MPLSIFQAPDRSFKRVGWLLQFCEVKKEEVLLNYEPFRQ